MSSSSSSTTPLNASIELPPTSASPSVPNNTPMATPQATPQDEFRAPSVTPADMAKLRAMEEAELAAIPKVVLPTNVPLPTPPRAGPIRERPTAQPFLMVDPEDDIKPRSSAKFMPKADTASATPDTRVEEFIQKAHKEAQLARQRAYVEGIRDGAVNGAVLVGVLAVGFLGWAWWTGRFNVSGLGLKLTAGPIAPLSAQALPSPQSQSQKAHAQPPK